MKKVYSCLLTLCLFSLAHAQYSVTYVANGGNPGALHSEDEFSGSGWTSIYDCTTISYHTHVYSTTQTIPFSFEFNGSSVTQFKASNSGYITFDVSHATPASAFSVGNLPAAGIPDNSVCAWGIYTDYQSTFAKMETKVFGSSGSQQLWIVFRSFYNPNGTDDFDFTYWAIVLEEGTNNIYVVRQWEITFGGVWENFPVSVGVQIDGSTAIEAPSNPISIAEVNTSNTSSDNDYWEFSPTTTGIADNEAQIDITVFPNPANDYITITGLATNVQVFDITGQLILQQDITSGTTIDISGLEAGYYTISAFSEEGVTTETLVVQ